MCVCVIEVANRGVLAEMEIQIAASGSENEGAVNRGCPDDSVFDQAFDVFEHRVAVIRCLRKLGVCIGAKQN